MSDLNKESSLLFSSSGHRQYNEELSSVVEKHFWIAIQIDSVVRNLVGITPETGSTVHFNTFRITKIL